MKRSIFLLFCTIIVFCCMAGKCSSREKSTQESASETTAEFEKDTHDFGKITASNGKVEYSFSFYNTGKTPLVITKVDTSCGCTATEWTKEPIAPRKQGFIKAVYDPEGNKGPFIKHITVYYNGNPPIIRLKIQGEVE